MIDDKTFRFSHDIAMQREGFLGISIYARTPSRINLISLHQCGVVFETAEFSKILFVHEGSITFS